MCVPIRFVRFIETWRLTFLNWTESEGGIGFLVVLGHAVADLGRCEGFE